MSWDCWGCFKERQVCKGRWLNVRTESRSVGVVGKGAAEGKGGAAAGTEEEGETSLGKESEDGRERLSYISLGRLVTRDSWNEERD